MPGVYRRGVDRHAPLSLRQKIAEAAPSDRTEPAVPAVLGASAMVYSRWRRKLPSWVQVRPVELPGRGARMAEPLHTDMQALARQLASEQRLAAMHPTRCWATAWVPCWPSSWRMSCKRWAARRWRCLPAARRPRPGAKITMAGTGASQNRRRADQRAA